MTDESSSPETLQKAVTSAPFDRSELRLPPPPSNVRIAIIWHLRQWTRDLLISLAASVLIITCLYQPVRVEGTSMQPRLHDQDRLFINKFVYRFEKVSRGDVVVFHYPRDPEKSYIKRVIALPGDDVRINDGEVFVNGERAGRALCAAPLSRCPLDG